MRWQPSGPRLATGAAYWLVGATLTTACLAPLGAAAVESPAGPATARLKHESFDRDPGWEGVNHRSARLGEPVRVRQDFGYQPDSNHAGGERRGEAGGYLQAAGEAAYYAATLEPATLDGLLSARGKLMVGPGATHLLLGFFHHDTLGEWRTPNTLALRIQGRGDKFYAYVEYCTSKWRAGGDTTPFPSTRDAETGRMQLIGFPAGRSLTWSLRYDPQAGDGRGRITATIGDATAACDLEAGHRLDGATFDRFGLLAVMKSADGGSPVWIDDLTLLDRPVETFDRDPRWTGRRNRGEYATRLVRPWFDFGWSDSQFAGGQARGELGGQIFRGDCREASRMACYGDVLETLTLDRPIEAAGRVVLLRGVSDSTTLFGFYHRRRSLRVNEAQNDGLPECVLGLQIEGPSSEGFKIYPVFRGCRSAVIGDVRSFPAVYPNRESHAWKLRYEPHGAEGGSIRLTFDGESYHLTLRSEDFGDDVSFDRFGIVTTWIDGNGQQVYWDDLTYTTAQGER